MSDDVPDLKALRGDRMASDAEYIEQLEQLSLGQERELRKLRQDRDEHEFWVSLASATATERDALRERFEAECEERERLVEIVAEYERAAVAGALDAIGIGESIATVITERDELRVTVETCREVLALIAEDDELVEENDAAFGLHAYRRCRDQARYVIGILDRGKAH